MLIMELRKTDFTVALASHACFFSGSLGLWAKTQLIEVNMIHNKMSTEYNAIPLMCVLIHRDDIEQIILLAGAVMNHIDIGPFITNIYIAAVRAQYVLDIVDDNMSWIHCGVEIKYIITDCEIFRSFVFYDRFRRAVINECISQRVEITILYNGDDIAIGCIHEVNKLTLLSCGFILTHSTAHRLLTVLVNNAATCERVDP